jgi:hypothetical protein
MGFLDYIGDSALSFNPPRRSQLSPDFRPRLDPSGKYGRLSAWNPALRLECPRARHGRRFNCNFIPRPLLLGMSLYVGPMAGIRFQRSVVCLSEENQAHMNPRISVKVTLQGLIHLKGTNRTSTFPLRGGNVLQRLSLAQEKISVKGSPPWIKNLFIYGKEFGMKDRWNRFHE